MDTQGPLEAEEHAFIASQPWWIQLGEVECGIYSILTFIYLLDRENYHNAVAEPFCFSDVHTLLPRGRVFAPLTIEEESKYQNDIMFTARKSLYLLANRYWVQDCLQDGKPADRGLVEVVV